eukprot:486611_1
MSPFKYQRLNILEGICLFSLIAIIGGTARSNQDNKTFTDVFIGLIIIFPFIFICYYVARSISWICWKLPNFNAKHIAKIKQRVSIPITDNCLDKSAEENKETEEIQTKFTHDDNDKLIETMNNTNTKTAEIKFGRTIDSHHIDNIVKDGDSNCSINLSLSQSDNIVEGTDKGNADIDNYKSQMELIKPMSSENENKKNDESNESENIANVDEMMEILEGINDDDTVIIYN